MWFWQFVALVFTAIGSFAAGYVVGKEILKEERRP